MRVAPNFKNWLRTIIKLKRTDMVIKAILDFVCPVSFINDLCSKMHQFAHGFLYIFSRVTPPDPLVGRGKPLVIPHRRLQHLGSSAAHARCFQPSHFQNHADVHDPVTSVRDLGIYIDADLSLRTHVQRTMSCCFVFSVSCDRFAGSYHPPRSRHWW